MKKKLCGFRFLMEMEPGWSPFLKKKNKKLLAHGTLLHFASNITLTAAIESVFGHGRVGGLGQLHF